MLVDVGRRKLLSSYLGVGGCRKENVLASYLGVFGCREECVSLVPTCAWVSGGEMCLPRFFVCWVSGGEMC